MILPYNIRLLCLCFATYFVVHVAVWLVVRAITPAALCIAETMRPRPASRLLFGLRVAPSAVALFGAVNCVCFVIRCCRRGGSSSASAECVAAVAAPCSRPALTIPMHPAS